jgi:3-hydroxyisobutyrate dehydrogenase
MARSRIGFVGIGNMGWPMAANVARGGFPLTVFDADPERARRFAAEHPATAAPSLAELGQAADIVVTMLPDGHVVRRALLEADGGALAGALARGAVVVDMSSSAPVGTQELGRELARRGIALLDAPVSGGVPRAMTGKLAIMIGHDDAVALARVKPLLATLGDRLFETGGLGSGHAMKALNNFCAAASYAATAEAVVVGRRFGLDPAVVIDVINASTGRSFNSEMVFRDQVLSGRFAAGFALGLLAKDVGIAADLARHLGVEAPVGRLVDEMWTRARDTLGATADFTAAITCWDGTEKK